MHHFTWKWLRCHYAHAHSLWNYLKHLRCLEEWHIVKAFFVNIIISVSSLVHQHRTYIPDMMLLLGEVFVSCVVSFMGFRLYPVGFSTCGFIQYITSTLCEWTQYMYVCVCVCCSRSLTFMCGGPVWSCWPSFWRTSVSSCRPSSWSAQWVSPGAAPLLTKPRATDPTLYSTSWVKGSAALARSECSGCVVGSDRHTGMVFWDPRGKSFRTPATTCLGLISYGRGLEMSEGNII